jgi:hypothetical protein
MANKYVDAIASSLEEFQNTDFLNFISDKQVFIDMAWSGLQGTDAFKKYPVGSGDEERFENRFSAELIGADYGGQMLLKTLLNIKQMKQRNYTVIIAIL